MLGGDITDVAHKRESRGYRGHAPLSRMNIVHQEARDEQKWSQQQDAAEGVHSSKMSW